MKILMFLTAVLAAVVPVWGEEYESAHYTLNVANFNAITVVDGINVVYECRADSAGWAVFDSAPELASKISFSNNKEHLRIQTLADEKPFDNLPTVKVYSASLRYAENSGDSLLTVNAGCGLVEKFTAKQIGNGKVAIHGVEADRFDGDAAAGHGSLEVDGKAGKAKFRNVGTGLIDAQGLVCVEVDCFILGPGKVHVSASDKVKLTGAGAGRVVDHAGARKTVNRAIGIKSVTPEEADAQKP